jgi:hypothetical protein
MSKLEVNGTGTFRFFVIVGEVGYACKEMNYANEECVLYVAAIVNQNGWYWPDAELRFPKTSVKQILPGAWRYGEEVCALSDRVKLVTKGHW